MRTGRRLPVRSLPHRPEAVAMSYRVAFLPFFESGASAKDAGSLDKNSSVLQSARTRLVQLASRTADT